MIYTLHIRPAATREAAAVYAYHEQLSAGLGDRFIEELRECYMAIQRNPLGFQLRKGNYRHAVVPGFRYRVVFEVEGAEVHVYQLRHTSRKESRKFGP